jgi:hypothetical protein
MPERFAAIMKPAPSAARDCAKNQIPPASAAWYFNFHLRESDKGLLETTDFSCPEAHLLRNFRPLRKAKLILHATEVGDLSENWRFPLQV